MISSKIIRQTDSQRKDCILHLAKDHQETSRNIKKNLAKDHA